MTLSVSGPVYAAVKALAVEADGAVQLLQNQVDAAKAAADEYRAILGELTDASQVIVSAVDGQPFLADSPGIG